jgi:hypothetical protein
MTEVGALDEEIVGTALQIQNGENDRLTRYSDIVTAFLSHTLILDDALNRRLHSVNITELKDVLHHDDLVEAVGVGCNDEHVGQHGCDRAPLTVDARYTAE